ncbi:uroporphyrinogen-III C-methyltransferase [Parapedobacter sp.]
MGQASFIRKQQVDPRITLVGAGPGDPDLISLKGIKALKTANVILYDALVDEQLLTYAPSETIKVYVGNPSGDENFSQDVVNQLMVDYALNFGHVVRLKGGDLFVFGRGYEELEYAASYSIETSVVPGISSAISVPGLQGIPVTHKGVSNSLWILSGCDDEGNLSAELKDAAQSRATVVVLLGFDKLPEIVALYQTAGKGRLPVAAIQNGSMANEKVAIGIVNTIVEVTEEKQLDNTGPVLLVFGSAVELNRQFHPIRRFFQLTACSEHIGE